MQHARTSKTPKLVDVAYLLLQLVWRRIWLDLVGFSRRFLGPPLEGDVLRGALVCVLGLPAGIGRVQMANAILHHEETGGHVQARTGRERVDQG